MRILLLYPDSKNLERPPFAHARGLAAALLRAGHLVECAVGAGSGHAELAPLQSRGLALHMLPARPARDSFERLFAACRPDLVIERLVPQAPHGAETAIQFGASHLWELAGPLSEAPDPGARRNGAADAGASLERCFATSRAAITLSPEAAEWLRPRVPGDFEVLAIPSEGESESLGPIEPARRKWAESVIGLCAGEFLVGFSGALKPWHDLETLVLAVERLRARIPARLVIVGDGPSRNPLLEQTSRHQTPAVLAGSVSPREARALLACCDVVAVPYARAGADFSPLRLVEAMAAGRPIVATETGPTRRILVEGGSGLLVPPGDPAAMAHAFEKLAAQPELREKLADAARRRAAQHYYWDEVVERLLHFAGSRKAGAESCA
jgi:glycosyltransferase involved in cell wall biosynthesis